MEFIREIGQGAFGVVWLVRAIRVLHMTALCVCVLCVCLNNVTLQAKWRNSEVVVKKLFSHQRLSPKQLKEFKGEVSASPPAFRDILLRQFHLVTDSAPVQANIMLRLRPHKNIVQLMGVCLHPVCEQLAFLIVHPRGCHC